MEKKLNIQRTLPAPADRPDCNEWVKEYKVSSAYVEPVRYYEGNVITYNGVKDNIFKQLKRDICHLLNW